MALKNNNFKKTSGVGFEKGNQVLGLTSFTKNLEKYFFASVSTYFSTKRFNKINIVLEMHFNFDLSEVLYHYESGTWGCVHSKNHTFLKFVTQLKDANNIYIEIDELTLHFNDTSIIINQIYENSIAEQFDAILHKINKNYFSFSQGKSSVPFEIFIPVFEEDNHVNNGVDRLYHPSTAELNYKDYFKYWALYYNGEKKAAIYDSRSSLITSGKLYYLDNE